MMADEKIKNSSELEFVVFCIENVAAKLGMDAERVYQAFAEKSDILSGYIVPEFTKKILISDMFFNLYGARI